MPRAAIGRRGALVATVAMATLAALSPPALGVTVTKSACPSTSVAFIPLVNGGAKTSVRLATLADDGPTGGYFHLGDKLPW